MRKGDATGGWKQANVKVRPRLRAVQPHHPVARDARVGPVDMPIVIVSNLGMTEVAAAAVKSAAGARVCSPPTAAGTYDKDAPPSNRNRRAQCGAPASGAGRGQLRL